MVSAATSLPVNGPFTEGLEVTSTLEKPGVTHRRDRGPDRCRGNAPALIREDGLDDCVSESTSTVVGAWELPPALPAASLKQVERDLIRCQPVMLL